MSTMPEARPAVNPGRKPRPKPARSVRLLIAPTHTMPGICRITVQHGRKVETTDYNLYRVQSDFGRAFRLVKLLGEHDGYNVLLSPDGRHSCECMGHSRWGTPCKHILAMSALTEKGIL